MRDMNKLLPQKLVVLLYMEAIQYHSKKIICESPESHINLILDSGFPDFPYCTTRYCWVSELVCNFYQKENKANWSSDVISCDADFAWRNDLAAGRNGRRPVGFFLFPGNFVTPPRFLLLTSDAHGQTHLLDFSLIRLNRSRWV
jgi:hypothetical protein